MIQVPIVVGHFGGRTLFPSRNSIPLTHWGSLGLLSILVVACGPQQEHAATVAEAEVHGRAPIQVTLYTDLGQLFMEYPVLVAGQEARFFAHVTVLEDGAPVESGSVRLELGPASSPDQVVAIDSPKMAGLFIPTGKFDQAGSFEARIVVDSPQLQTAFPLPDFTVHPDDASADAAAAAAVTEEPDDAIPFLLEQMWPLRMKARPVARRSMTEWLHVPGVVDARPDSLSRVGAPVDGVLVQQGEHAHIGDWVEEGDFLGFVEAPLTTSDRAQLEAVRTDLLAREMELESKQIEVERDLLEAKAEADFARLQHDRLIAMREKGLGTEAALDAASRDVLLAETRLAGSEKLKQSFAETRERLVGMRQELFDGLGGSDGSAMRYPLVAPISGEIAAVKAHKGDPVRGQETLFTILRSDRVWIEAEVSEFDLARLDPSHRARMQAPLFGDAILDFADDLNGTRIHVGRMVDPVDRSIKLRFEIDNPESKMPLGMFVDVLLASKSSKDALAVPESAIVRDLGVDVVYVVVAGETLQRREVFLGIRDGGFVEVQSGLKEGERVIVSDAFRVRLASASPASFGEGHTH